MVWLPLVQYYTGQLFDIAPIAKKSHEVGALIGLDMAHGIGNVECHLNEWEVDIAVWCTYKYGNRIYQVAIDDNPDCRYLNSGPAGIGGYYIKSDLDDGGRRYDQLNRLSTDIVDSLAGWWGNDAISRFQMGPTFQPTPGAKGYQHSCTPVFSSIALLATLNLIDKVGFNNMVIKGRQLTGTLETMLKASRYYRPPPVPSSSAFPSAEESKEKVGFRLITPSAPWRGSQLSLFITPHRKDDGAGKGVMPRVFGRMIKKGLVGDEREPSVIRLSPVVLYNTFQEIGRAVEILEEALMEEEEWERTGGNGKDVAVARDMLSGNEGTKEQ